MSPAKRRIDRDAGRGALARCLTAVDAGEQVDPADVRTAVRFTLEELAHRHPGRNVEVRVPPYAAVQAIEGPRHTRGTPPNVVEMDAVTWLRLVGGRTAWAEEVHRGAVKASGARSDLSAFLPLLEP